MVVKLACYNKAIASLLVVQSHPVTTVYSTIAVKLVSYGFRLYRTEQAQTSESVVEENRRMRPPVQAPRRVRLKPARAGYPYLLGLVNEEVIFTRIYRMSIMDSWL